MIIYNNQQIQLIRQASKLASDSLKYIEKHLKPGITTNYIDEVFNDFIAKNNCKSSILNYHGFPKSICTSVNEVACHGIPNDLILKDGDIINVDITINKDEFHGDTSKTFIIGNASDKAIKLVKLAEESMHVGIKSIKHNVPLNSIGISIEEFAIKNNLYIVKQLHGHGIGNKMHTEPFVPHYRTSIQDKLQKGMVITVEPVVSMYKLDILTLEDGWTLVDINGNLSAQFEHTVLVTEDGYEILTL